MNFRAHDICEFFHCVAIGAPGIGSPDFPHNDELQSGEFYPVQKLHPQWPYGNERKIRYIEHMPFEIESGLIAPPARRPKGNSLAKEVGETMNQQPAISGWIAHLEA